MDTQLSILVFNLFLNLVIVLDHMVQRIRKSSCFGVNIEMNETIIKKSLTLENNKKVDDNINKKDNNNNISKNDIIILDKV